jgi:mannose-1-phosphate guanylyltransferase
MKFIVTAGGQGTKLWPYSRDAKPKQFQQVVGDKTLFKYNIEVLLTKYSINDIYISTKDQYIDFVLADFPDFPRENLIVEPNIKKNRGPAEGLAFMILALRHPNEPFFLVQSDCIRKPEENFLKMIAAAEEMVQRDRKFISGGIKATFPIMGIDYLKLGDSISNSHEGIDTYAVSEFVYRPDDYEATKRLISDYHICTHSNHNCWYPELMMEAYKKYRPDWYEALMKMQQFIGKPDQNERVAEIYATMAEGPTEEVTKHIFPEGYIILLPFQWTDVGTWESVYEYFGKRGEVYKDGEIIDIDSTNSLIKGRKGKIIATIGIDNLIIVDTDDALLICSKDKTGEIGKILKELKLQNLEKYL